MRGLTARRAAASLASDVEAFERLGYRPRERRSPHEVVLGAPRGGRDLLLRLTREGRFFGGNWGLEVSTAEPVLAATSRGLAARGRGLARTTGVRFRARRGSDGTAAELAELLTADARLGEALARVHFERLWVEPDGRPVIRHLGGSLVWIPFPPVIRATPLPPQQVPEIVAALDAFADVEVHVGASGSGRTRPASATRRAAAAWRPRSRPAGHRPARRPNRPPR